MNIKEQKLYKLKEKKLLKLFSNVELCDFVIVFSSYKEVLRNLICNPRLEYLS
jgi:5-methylthioribose kinase